MQYYFVKRRENIKSFFAQLTEDEVRQRAARGEIDPEWFITPNLLGESYHHFVRTPRTPANWVLVKSFLEDEQEDIFDSDLHPPEVTSREGGGLLSFQGRVSRARFWVTWFGSSIAILIAGLLIGLLSPISSNIALILYVLTIAMSIWISLAILVKRWHDRNKSGWMILINFIPVVGTLWTLIELGFFVGTKWANKYGSDPTL